MIIGGNQVRFTDWGEAISASAIVHVAAAVFVFDLIGDIPLRTAPDDQTKEITVTTLFLGGDTVTSSAEAGASESEPAPVAPEPIAPVDPTDPDALTPVEPETPDQSEPIGADPLALDPVAPEEANNAVEPSILRPTETGAVPLGVATVVGTGTSAVVPERLGAIERAPIVSTTAPATVIPADPDQGDSDVEASGEINELALRIRAQLDDACLLAIPQATGTGVPELVMLGDTDTGMQAFAETVLAGLTPRPVERSILVDNRQCGALNFVRQSAAYPTFRLTMTLDSQVIASGENLTGTIGNVGGRYVTLVLVDDNGVVQGLGDYLRFQGGFARFDVPLNRVGIARDTKLLLLAFGSTARPRTVDLQNGQLSNVYFTELRAELGPNTPMVVVPFDVR